MKNHLIVERYAGALSEALPDAGDLDQALAALQEFVELYTEQSDFRAVLDSPSIDPKKRLSVLNDILDTLGTPNTTANFIRTVFRRGRIALIHEISVLFRAEVDRRLGRVVAEVTTAVALSTEQRDRLCACLSRYSGKDVHIEARLDPETLGGVVVRFENKVIDGSFRARLEGVKQALLTKEN